MLPLFGPAPACPPELGADERMLFEGSFDPGARAKDAVVRVVLLAALISLLSAPMGATGLAVPLVPCALAVTALFLVHRNRDRVTTDRAICIPGAASIEKARIRRFGARGASITAITGHGTNRRPLGARCATRPRDAMNGALL